MSEHPRSDHTFRPARPLRRRGLTRVGLVLSLAVLTGAGAVSGAPSGTASAPAQEPRVISARDTLRVSSVGSPAISPDDEWVLYTRSERDMEDEELSSTTHVWRVRIDGTDRRQLTRGDDSASSPEWFPDGTRIAFRTARGEDADSQVWAMYVDGGEAWQVTEHEDGVSDYAISPDGTKVLFTARDPLTEEEEKKQEMRDDAEVVDADFRMTHLWVHDMESGEETRLTEGELTVSDPRWSPDSSRIAYVTRITPKVDDSSWSDVWVADVASGTTRKLHENAGPDTSPRWSPDGTTVAFAATRQEGNTQWYRKLHLIPAEGGEPRVLLEEFDLSFGAPIWSPDGETIYWSTGEGTTTNLFGVALGSGELVHRRAPMRGGNGSFTLSHDGRTWVFSHSDPARSGELYATPVEGGEVVQLTDANPWIEKEGIRLGRVETIRWRNGDGQWIEGVLTWPVGAEPREEGPSYPLIVNPHGGPSGAVIESFSSTNHFLAGNGFMVLQPNFRGSSNYGQEFLNANRDNWGIRDYDDIMTGVDHVVAQGWADPDRMVAYGWSYGGYMTFWMSTQTDRFKVISPGAGLSNLYSMYSTTDIPAYLGWFFGTPWENEDIYRQLSPIRHADSVTARILIMHGAEDARVPPEQAVEFYKAMRDLGKDVTFVRYPRQGHGIGEPRLAMDRLRRYVCAFTDALGMESATETCADGKPVVAIETDEEVGGSMIEVGAAPSAADPALAAGMDSGIFEVVEPWIR